jgi:hypothetical protein
MSPLDKLGRYSLRLLLSTAYMRVKAVDYLNYAHCSSPIKENAFCK